MGGREVHSEVGTCDGCKKKNVIVWDFVGTCLCHECADEAIEEEE